MDSISHRGEQGYDTSRLFSQGGNTNRLTNRGQHEFPETVGATKNIKALPNKNEFKDDGL